MAGPAASARAWITPRVRSGSSGASGPGGIAPADRSHRPTGWSGARHGPRPPSACDGCRRAGGSASGSARPDSPTTGRERAVLEGIPGTLAPGHGSRSLPLRPALVIAGADSVRSRRVFGAPRNPRPWMEWGTGAAGALGHSGFAAAVVLRASLPGRPWALFTPRRRLRAGAQSWSSPDARGTARVRTRRRRSRHKQGLRPDSARGRLARGGSRRSAGTRTA